MLCYRGPAAVSHTMILNAGPALVGTVMEYRSWRIAKKGVAGTVESQTMGTTAP